MFGKKRWIFLLFALVLLESCGGKFVRPKDVAAPQKVWELKGEYEKLDLNIGQDKAIFVLSNSVNVVDLKTGSLIAEYKFKQNVVEGTYKKVALGFSQTNQVLFLNDSDSTNLVALDLSTKAILYKIPISKEIIHFQCFDQLNAFAFISKRKIHFYDIKSGQKKWETEEINDLPASYFGNFFLPIVDLSERKELFIVAGLGMHDLIRKYVVSEGSFYIINSQDGVIKKKNKLKMTFSTGENSEPNELFPYLDPYKMFWSYALENNRLYLSSVDLACINLDEGNQLWVKEIRSSDEDSAFAGSILLALMAGATAAAAGAKVTFYSRYSTYGYYTPPSIAFSFNVAQKFNELRPRIIRDKILLNDFYGGIRIFDKLSGKEIFNTEKEQGTRLLNIANNKEFLYYTTGKRYNPNANQENQQGYNSSNVKNAKVPEFKEVEIDTTNIISIYTNKRKFSGIFTNQNNIYAYDENGILMLGLDLKTSVIREMREILSNANVTNKELINAKILSVQPVYRSDWLALIAGDSLILINSSDLTFVNSYKLILKRGISSVEKRGNYLMFMAIDNSGMYYVLNCVDLASGKYVYMIPTSDRNFISSPDLNIMVGTDNDVKYKAVSGYYMEPKN